MEKKLPEKKLPENKKYPLTEKEKEGLIKLLNHTEIMKWMLVKHQTSCYSESKATCLTKNDVKVSVKWGVDGQWHDKGSRTVDRSELFNLSFNK